MGGGFSHGQHLWQVISVCGSGAPAKGFASCCASVPIRSKPCRVHRGCACLRGACGCGGICPRAPENGAQTGELCVNVTPCKFLYHRNRQTSVHRADGALLSLTWTCRTPVYRCPRPTPRACPVLPWIPALAAGLKQRLLRCGISGYEVPVPARRPARFAGKQATRGRVTRLRLRAFGNGLQIRFFLPGRQVTAAYNWFHISLVCLPQCSIRPFSRRILPTTNEVKAELDT